MLNLHDAYNKSLPAKCMFKWKLDYIFRMFLLLLVTITRKTQSPFSNLLETILVKSACLLACSFARSYACLHCSTRCKDNYYNSKLEPSQISLVFSRLSCIACVIVLEIGFNELDSRFPKNPIAVCVFLGFKLNKFKIKKFFFIVVVVVKGRDCFLRHIVV